ncbi:MAG: polyprenyl synthetase family protein [Clostridiales bacterium]|nr:polyprenyl synthetase family protein [Clostridiales bacterium]
METPNEMLKQWMDAWLPRLEQALKEAVSQEQGFDKKLWQAMEYSLLAGGKRLRPAFLMLSGLALGAKEEELTPFAIALEMIHTYSLIHDDLPAMDNDDYRRGRLTNHKVFGEGMAVLAGDGLLNLAAETMADACMAEAPEQQPNALRAMQRILHAAGPSGMIAGQTADIEAEEKRLGAEGLAFIDHNKTGQLLCAPFVCGALLAGAEPSVCAALEQAGFRIGTAFQIQDDILDIEGDAALLGKATGSDALNHKETFVTVYGLEEAKEAAKRLSKEALVDLEVLPGPYGAMARALTASLITRKY